MEQKRGYQGEAGLEELGDIARWADKHVKRLSRSQQESLGDYCRFLYASSDKINLIAPEDRKNLTTKHVLPALCMGNILALVPHRTVLDFGSGAGLPGIPLKILFPESQFILVESRRRRANFLRAVVRELGLKQIEVHNSRIEELHQELAGSVDVMVTRAVADVESLGFYAGPILTSHGVVITTLDSQRGYRRSRGLLIRRKSNAMGGEQWFGMLR